MRNTDPLTEELRRWGHAQVNRFALSRADRSVHVLDKVRDHAPLTRERAIQDLVGRDGTDRRRLMAAGAGVKGLRIVPLWAADPIRASNDADHPHDNPEIAVDVGVPDELRWIDRALASMERQYPMRALIVRTEFTVSASQAVKARMVAEKYDGKLTLRQYRYELGRGLDSVRGSAAA
ncbi:hypothetical protein EN794_004595 [Mesorhizobium sp. M00.F.Ca.ET.151.01.1.1]|nr:hypothetical protein EN842_05250 [bacterium M00.F.Ca.ET.199.01.1.1]TGT08752.1 hypothetical protein EN820_00435 [bacterium M00.F.Ca.ET.177.01.1.1]TGT66686.1 hypothetical protein EN813_000435 [Mesorhizobium sp. M00.F.Ca.ET.170.01.1.1]TGU15599.1 hypothetical protein EN806_00435 [bacterium M00.F.Ca.ET.163.01.1.1]TGU98325.1 hypothetical protein EN794_004595 [Mesorhizobium sp. M00.F.Ca.ET.151.01.1.1]TGV59991.1 hypothetical protein EN784_05985 [bacterium M00.F.Ca.ET.141.01.1.1]